ncbi:hypothetical protein ADIS_3291 [Lunatimonas lonarensis]|uniref:Uncharacterized protein n=1 Tax=Lunatimonas lonarensis TaxID=1232681 RepID=R7ZQ37_9BACT|nr:hypothetical protein ADIS_3291 [Lunatimonas lonarensis]
MAEKSSFYSGIAGVRKGVGLQVRQFSAYLCIFRSLLI